MYLLASKEFPVFEMSSIIAFFCKQYLRDESCYLLQCLIPTFFHMPVFHGLVPCLVICTCTK